MVNGSRHAIVGLRTRVTPLLLAPDHHKSPGLITGTILR